MGHDLVARDRAQDRDLATRAASHFIHRETPPPLDPHRQLDPFKHPV
jgi:hypothetical protein